MNKKRTYGRKDFVIDESTIPAARPIKLMDGSWGVFVSHEEIPEVRNHLIVSVQTKGGKTWYAKLATREHEDKQGVAFSTDERRIDLTIEAEARYLLYRQRRVEMSQGKLFRTSDVVIPDQHEKIFPNHSKNSSRRRPKQRKRSRSR